MSITGNEYGHSRTVYAHASNIKNCVIFFFLVIVSTYLKLLRSPETEMVRNILLSVAVPSTLNAENNGDKNTDQQ